MDDLGLDCFVLIIFLCLFCSAWIISSRKFHTNNRFQTMMWRGKFAGWLEGWHVVFFKVNQLDSANAWWISPTCLDKVAYDFPNEVFICFQEPGSHSFTTNKSCFNAPSNATSSSSSSSSSSSKKPHKKRDKLPNLPTSTKSTKNPPATSTSTQKPPPACASWSLHLCHI